MRIAVKLIRHPAYNVIVKTCANDEAPVDKGLAIAYIRQEGQKVTTESMATKDSKPRRRGRLFKGAILYKLNVAEL